MSYNYMELINGSNFMEWMIIINNWGEGHPIGIFFMIFGFVVLGIMKSSGVSFENSLIGSSFITFVMLLLAWSARFQGLALVPTFYPVVLGLMLAMALFMKVMSKLYGSQ